MSDIAPEGDWRARLRQVLTEKSLSMRKVSLEAGLGPGAVHSWLSEGKDPSVTNLMDVARVIGVTLVWLTKGYDITPKGEEILSRLENDPDREDSVLTLLRGSSPRRPSAPE